MSVQEALAQLPVTLRTGLDVAYQEGGEMVNALLERDEMEPARALMAGLALNPVGRDLFEDALDIHARAARELPNEWPEVIIGGGAHAAIWAATRATLNSQGPLVLEKNARFGGTFALTSKATFFLNSRNRPGPIGTSGSRDALNVIPGAPMQPSDMSGSEYQANADLGLVVRCTLALNATVRQAVVSGIVKNGERIVVMTDRGNVAAKRVIVATGLGPRLKPAGSRYDDRLLSFEGFMRRFDRSMFPLRNLGRVAVVGDGDSGRTVIEALTGYGPYMGGSVASLDYVPQIDWYGLEPNMTKERWLECNRTRYKPLAALFPSVGGTVSNARVRGFPQARLIFRTTDAIQVNENSYDTVVVCFGFKAGVPSSLTIEGFVEPTEFRSGNQNNRPEKGVMLGRATPDRSFVIVGPAADLPFQSICDPEPRIEQNKVALFRLAPRTATLADMLPVT